MAIVWVVFFFQAEDGIRDVAVTGVQTCALPIYAGASRRPHSHRRPLAADARRRRNLFLQSSERWLYGGCRRSGQSHVQAVWRSRLFARRLRARGAVAPAIPGAALR